MESKFCRQCGRPLIEGKRFCGRCGKEAPRPAEPGAELPAPEQSASFPSPWTSATEPEAASSMAEPMPVPRSGRLCRACGNPLMEDKRFCGCCGNRVTPLAEAAFMPVAPKPEAPPIEEQPQAGSAIETPRAISVPEPAPFPNQESGSLSGSPVASKDVSLPAAASTPACLQALPWKRIAMAAGAGAVLCALIAGVFFMLHARRRGVTSASGVITVAGAPVGSAIALAAKPNAGRIETPEQAASPAPLLLPMPPKAPRETPPGTPSPASATQARLDVPRTPSIPQPPSDVAPASTPIPSETSATLRSGVLHYNGPPVHYGGVVAFPNLGGGRMRFVFDHQSWQALISRKSDGTQTLTLRSIRHEDQSYCDVQWEAVE